MKIIVVIASDVMNGDDSFFGCPDCVYTGTYIASQSLISVTNSLPDVLLLSTMLSDFVAGMCMGLAKSSTANRVLNGFNLQKADDAETTVAAHVHNDEQLY